MGRHRPTHEKYDAQESSPASSEHSTLKALIQSRLNADVGQNGPPGVDEEAKRIFFRDLARLKEQRYTHRECALMLNVSERSITTYIADPLYLEVQQEMINDAKQRGHLLISEMVDESLQHMYHLMHNGSSHFVQFKAAEYLLNAAGYSIPREEAQTDSREGIEHFRKSLEDRRKEVLVSSSSTIVHVQVMTQDHEAPQTMLVEGSILPEEHVETRPYYQHTVLPGGKLPIQFQQEVQRNI